MLRFKAVGLGLAFAMVLFLSSCVTNFYGPLGHVDWSNSPQVKGSEQSSNINGSKDKVASTFDDEFVYDDKGNIVKQKQTEYIDRLSADKKFVLWETEYKVLGGQVVPWKISVNGTAFVEVEWDVLTAKHEGIVKQDTTRYFYRQASGFLTASFFSAWRVDLDRYPVAFRADGKFVKEIQKVDDGYLDTDNYLTLGYGNIVLKRFAYSSEKLVAGYTKSYIGRSAMFSQMNKGNSVEFTYQWQAINDKICQTEAKYKSTYSNSSGLSFGGSSSPANIDFTASMEFNSSGDRTKETWSLVDQSQIMKSDKPIKIFEQILKY